MSDWIEQYTLCDRTLMPARNGTCVSHGGDACLKQFVPMELLEQAERALSEVTAKFQEQRTLLNKYETAWDTASGFHVAVEARAAAYHDDACSYRTQLHAAEQVLQTLRTRVFHGIMSGPTADGLLGVIDEALVALTPARPTPESECGLDEPLCEPTS